LNNQIAEIELDIPFQRVALAVIAGLLFISLTIYGVSQWQASDPYTRSVLSLEGQRENGQEIFQMNCAGCHGIQADGLVGPTLHGVATRRTSASLIQQVTSGKTPPMPQFQPKPQEMADLLAYLSQV
jgi:mono/diheme cytochrome c family protein